MRNDNYFDHGNESKYAWYDAFRTDIEHTV